MFRVAASPRRVRPLVLLVVLGLLASLGAVAPATLAAGGQARGKPTAVKRVERVVPRATSLGAGPTIRFVGPGGGSGACASPTFTIGSVGDGSPAAAIQAAVDASSTGDTVFLCDHLYDLTTGIDLTDNDAGPNFDRITFQGESTAGSVVSGGGSIVPFSGIGHDFTATIRGMTIRDGNGSGHSGSAFEGKHIEVLGAVFTGNDVEPAIAANGDLSLTDATCIGNYGSFGGVAYVFGTLRVEGGRYANNAAGIHGGVFYTYGDTKIAHATFIGNSADSEGGVLYANGAVSIVDSHFEDNTAGSNGGAVNAEGQGDVAITDGTFIRNVALLSDGGAIHMRKGVGTLTIEGGRFEANRAIYGGAVRAKGSSTYRDVAFVDNSTGGAGGGALYVNGHIRVEGGHFTGNTSPDDGGAAILAENGWDWGQADLVVRDVDFTDNTANSDEYYGGAINVDGSLDLSGGTFSGNSAGFGGAIFAQSPSAFSITDATFISNRATGRIDRGGGWGGAIYLAGGNGGGSITRSTFTGNVALDGGGGAVGAWPTSGTLSIVDSDFTANVFGQREALLYEHGGGAVFVGTNVPVRIEGGSFTDNSAGSEIGYGGALWAAFSSVEVTGATFARNIAGVWGGAVFSSMNDGFVSLHDADFIDNTAGDGGAVFANYPVTIRGGSYTRNVATNDGGVVRTNTVHAYDATFVGNRGGEGGALIGYAEVRTGGSTFRDNHASGSGGAIKSFADLEVTGATFADNSAGVDGGAIRAEGTARISGSTFTDDTAGANGGAISGAKSIGGVPSNIRLKGNTFARNVAGGDGGAIHATNTDMNDFVLFSIVSANDTYVENAAVNGGAIHAVGQGAGGSARIWLTYDTFVDNTAPGMGPHIFAANPGNVYAVDRVFRGVLFAGGGCWALGGGTVSGNVSDDASCPGTVVNAEDLLLGELADNGGSVPTIALGKGSAAIDPEDGEYVDCLDATDARLATDARGGKRLAYGTCDAGAFEYQAAPDRPTSIRISATVDGVEIPDGAEVTTGSVVVVRAWVTGQSEEDATAGMILIRACASQVALPAACEGGPAGYTSTSLEGTSGTDGIGEATWTFNADHGYLRLGAAYRVRGGIIGAPELTSGTPGFLMTRPAVLIWDGTAGTAVRTSGTSAVIRVLVRATTLQFEEGCLVGFTFGGTTTEVVSDRFGVAAATISGLANPGVNAISITTGDGCRTAPIAAIVTNGRTAFPKGTVGAVAGGWYVIDATGPGIIPRYATVGLRVEATTGTSGKGKTARTTVTSRISFAWVSSNGWRVTAETTDVTSATGATPVSPWRRTTCPTSVSDGTNTATTLPSGTICGQLSFRGTVSEWSSGTRTWEARGTQTFVVEIADAGTSRKTGDGTDWIALRSLGGGFSGVPTSFLRPLRAGYTSGAFRGRAFII